MFRSFRRAASLLCLCLAILSGCSVSVLLQPAPTEAPQSPTQTGAASVHYIDVGQGDATLIQTAGKNILIDGGPLASADALVSYLQSMHVRELDLCIATHPHEDHIGGIPDVLHTFTVKELYMPTKTTTTKIFRTMVETAQRRGVTISPAKVGDTFSIGDATLHILFPDQEYDDLNNNSVTVQMALCGKTFLFTGDNEKESESRLVKTFAASLKSDVLHAGHHGSSTSNTASFLRAVSPSVIVISCGKDNSYGHPHEEILQRYRQLGATVYRTDTDGTVVLSLDNGTMHVQKGVQ